MFRIKKEYMNLGTIGVNYSLYQRFSLQALSEYIVSFRFELETWFGGIEVWHREVKGYTFNLETGELYTLEDIIVDENQENAIATIIVKQLKYNTIRPKFTFKGLNPNYKYHISMRKQTNVEKYIEFEAFGDVLMNSKIDFGELFFSELDRANYGNTFASRMILIKKVN